MKINIVLILVSYLFLTSCGSRSTHYDPNSSNERRIAENIFQVEYFGETKNLQNAVDFCLLRCCEVALIKGYKYFRVTKSEKGIYNLLTKHADLNGEIGGSPVIIEGGYSRSAPKAIAENIIFCTNTLPLNRGGFIDAQKQSRTIISKYDKL